MKNLKQYLNEGLLSRKVSTKAPARYKPETKEDLRNIIVDLLKKGHTNLNCIDVSRITDMSYLFEYINIKIKDNVKEIDISEWDVSNVKRMSSMFAGCAKFNSDLSNWNVSNVQYMSLMFTGCEKFNSDLSNWNVSKVQDMNNMFYGCQAFNSDLSKWNINNNVDIRDMFDECVMLKKNKNIPVWYKNEITQL